MKPLILLISLFLLNSRACAQEGKIHHVTKSEATLYSNASDTSSAIHELKQYDNVKLLKIIDQNWSKVSYGNKEGYVQNKSLKEGKAVVTVQRVRTGAICRDGTRSSATGRGACSRHGGVREWILENKKVVRIIKE